MYSLQLLNVVKVTASESRRDSLLAQGYTLLYVEETEEPAAAPVETVVEIAPEPVKPNRIPMKTRKK